MGVSFGSCCCISSSHVLTWQGADAAWCQKLGPSCKHEAGQSAPTLKSWIGQRPPSHVHQRAEAISVIYVCQPAAAEFQFQYMVERTAWSEEFDDYCFASDLNEHSDEAQVWTLLHAIGRQASEIFQTFNLSEEEERKHDVVKRKFDNHFVGAENIVYESASFYSHNQGSGKSVDQCVIVLHTLAKRCDFDSFKDRMIHDRFVVVLRDLQLLETLQMGPDITLAAALTKARLKETILEQQQQLRHAKSHTASLIAETAVEAIRKEHFSMQSQQEGWGNRRHDSALG